MKVITLERIKDFVESKHGKQTISKFSIEGDVGPKNGIVVIHDEGTKCLRAYINKADELEFSGDESKVHCILLETDLEDFYEEHPFIKLREAIAGALVVDNSVVTEEEIHKYLYKI